jgi:hypothetical protein
VSCGSKAIFHLLKIQLQVAKEVTLGQSNWLAGKKNI